MKVLVFSIRDRAVLAHMNPFTSPTEAGAVRAFTDGINNPDTPMFAHPEDYDLYQHGSFDTGSGMYEVGVPVQVACGKDVKRAVANVPSLQTDAFERELVNGSVRR